MHALRTLCLLMAIAVAITATAVMAVAVSAGYRVGEAMDVPVPVRVAVLRPSSHVVTPAARAVRDDQDRHDAADSSDDEDVTEERGGQRRDGERDSDNETDDSQDDADTKAPRRVIVRINRHDTVAGFIEELDEHVLVMRTREGDLRSFSRGRVLQVIELLEPSPTLRGRLILRSGGEHTGVIKEDHFDYVLMEIEGVEVRFPREIVERVVPEPTFEEKYQHFKATITPDTPGRHLAFCRWLYEQRRYELAHEELTALLKHRNMAEARQLMTLVRAQLELERSRTDARGQDVDARNADDDSSPRASSRSRLPTTLLTPKEVNTIRVYEIDFDRPPRLNVESSTIHKLIEQYGTSPQVPASRAERAALHRANALEVVELMFELRARSLYPEIEVKSEPYALNLFRQRVHNAWLIPNCATSRCHGGPDAGEFFLHNRNYRDERVRFTNFLILERLDLDPQWPLINYQEPMMSRIIQYALPITEARLPHPEVPGWRPVFGRANRELLEDAVTWIDSMMKPRPDYPVAFDPSVDARVKPVDDRPAGDAPQPDER